MKRHRPGDELIGIDEYARLTPAQKDRYDRSVALARIEKAAGRPARNRAARRPLAEVLVMATGYADPGVARTYLMKLYAGAQAQRTGEPVRLC